MGGHNCGEVGSAITIQTVGEYLAAPENNLTREELAREAIRAANQKVLDAARLRTECDGMGSTIVMALWDGGNLVIANVGDSRAYLYRAGELRQLSYDQNFANELRTKLGFSEERVRNMPNRNVLTMAVGSLRPRAGAHPRRASGARRPCAALFRRSARSGRRFHDCQHSGGFRRFAAGSGRAPRLRQSKRRTGQRDCHSLAYTDEGNDG